MPVQPQPHAAMAALLAQLAAARAGSPNRYELPFPDARKQLLAERELWLDDGPSCLISLRQIRTAGRAVNLEVVRPQRCESDRVLVYLHGGGWCVGSPRTHEAIVRRLATALRCEAWSIDYALAPEHPWPAGLRDCIAAIEQVALERPDAQFIVAGDSAGASLALEAAIQLRDRRRVEVGRENGAWPDALLLFYGVYTRSLAGESMASFGDGRHGLSVAAHVRYLRAYLGGNADPAVPHTGFALDGGIDLEQLPRVFLLAAEIDILRDQTRAMAAALRASGNDVAEREASGVIHGFLAYGKALPDDVDAAIRAAADFALRAT